MEGVSGSGAGPLVVGGAADVVEEFLDVELGRGFGFGLELLDGLAGGLQLGLVAAAGDVDVIVAVTSGWRVTLIGWRPKLLDRMVQNHLAAVEA